MNLQMEQELNDMVFDDSSICNSIGGGRGCELTRILYTRKPLSYKDLASTINEQELAF